MKGEVDNIIKLYIGSIKSTFLSNWYRSPITTAVHTNKIDCFLMRSMWINLSHFNITSILYSIYCAYSNHYLLSLFLAKYNVTFGRMVIYQNTPNYEMQYFSSERNRNGVSLKQKNLRKICDKTLMGYFLLTHVGVCSLTHHLLFTTRWYCVPFVVDLQYYCDIYEKYQLPLSALISKFFETCEIYNFAINTIG